MLTKRQPKTRVDIKAETPDPAVFDHLHLQQYTNGDEALERELVGLFLGQFQPVRAQFAAARSADDWKFAAHSLKGSARSIGAPQIAALTEKLESIGFSAPARTKTGLLKKLDRAMAAFAAEAEKILD